MRPPSPSYPEIHQKKCKIIFIAPLWPRQPRFPQLLDLLNRPPIILPKRPDLLTLLVSKMLHPGLDSLNLCAWMLSSLPFERLALLKMLLPLQLNVDTRLGPMIFRDRGKWTEFVESAL